MVPCGALLQVLLINTAPLYMAQLAVTDLHPLLKVFLVMCGKVQHICC